MMSLYLKKDTSMYYIYKHNIHVHVPLSVHVQYLNSLLATTNIRIYLHPVPVFLSHYMYHIYFFVGRGCLEEYRVCGVGSQRFQRCLYSWWDRWYSSPPGWQPGVRGGSSWYMYCTCVQRNPSNQISYVFLIAKIIHWSDRTLFVSRLVLHRT